MIFQHVDQVFVKPDLSIARPRFGAALVTGDAALFDPFPSMWRVSDFTDPKSYSNLHDNEVTEMVLI
jgi:hypothetical protein